MSSFRALDEIFAPAADRILSNEEFARRDGMANSLYGASPELQALAAKFKAECRAKGMIVSDSAALAAVERDQLRRKAAEEAAVTFAQSAAIPKKFAGASLKGFNAIDGVQREAFKHVCRWANGIRAGNSPWLVLSGSWGTGKSLMACAALNSLRDAKGLSVRFVACVDLIRAIQGTYKDGASTSEAGIVSELARIDVLCLDDVGADPSAFEAKVLTRILDARYRNDLPTAIVTNLGFKPAADGGPSAFDAYVGDLIASRVAECADYVDCTTTDFRRVRRSIKEAA